MSVDYHAKKFVFGKITKPNSSLRWEISRLEEAEARALTGDPQEQLEIITERRRRRAQAER